MRLVFLSTLTLTVGLSSSLAAQPASGPLSQSQQVGVKGNFVAAINLPLAGGEGLLDGVLSLGAPLYVLHGELPSGPLFLNGETGHVSGPVGGALELLDADPSSDAVAEVLGLWSWNPATQTGYLALNLLLPGDGPIPGAPNLPIGVVRAHFADTPPVVPGGPDALGVATGTWGFYLVSMPAPIPDGDPYPGPTGGGDS